MPDAITNPHQSVVESINQAVNPRTDCGCLKKIRETLEAHHGVEVDLELKMWIHEPSLTTFPGLPPLRYSYMDGKKRKKSYVTFNFCPFCGKRI